MNRLFGAITACAVLAASCVSLVAPAEAQLAPQVTKLAAPPKTAMWIGNSFFYYNNGLPSHLSQLAASLPTKVPIAGTMVTIGGSGLDWHDVESYFRPNAIGSYSFDEHNTIVFAPPGHRYDAAIMMDCSQCPIHPKMAGEFLKTIKADAAIVRKHDATPILFMSWAYADHPEMTAALAEAYTKAGNEVGALVIPAGLAFARAKKARPDLVLNVEDLRHPTMAGTYLAAATSFSAIFGQSSEASTYTAGLDPELAKFLRTVAWETVQDYTSGHVTN